MIALNIAAFMPLAEFGARMEAFIAELKSTPLAAGSNDVFYPGEIEARNALRPAAAGLALPTQTLEDLAALGRQLKVPLDYV